MTVRPPKLVTTAALLALGVVLFGDPAGSHQGDSTGGRAWAAGAVHPARPGPAAPGR